MTWPQTRFSCQVGHVFWKLAFIYLLHHNCHLFASKLLQSLVPSNLITGTGLREKRATLREKIQKDRSRLFLRKEAKRRVNCIKSTTISNVRYIYQELKICYFYATSTFAMRFHSILCKKNYLLENTKKGCFQADVDFNVLSLVVQYTEYQPSSILTENEFTQEKSLYSWLWLQTKTMVISQPW